MDIDPAKWPSDPRLIPVWRSGKSVLYDVRPSPAQTRRATASSDTPNGSVTRPTR